MKFSKDKLQLRLYQQAILGTAAENNTLVVIPTGLGKTIIAVGMAGLLYEKGKILVMAPTKPLCVQHCRTFEEFFEAKLVVLTGAVPPEQRKEMWLSDVVFATPQTVTNDLIKGMFKFSDFSLVVFDEAHRAVGDYAYVWLAKQAHENCRILALSASPASDKEKLDEVKANLFISKIEVRTELDPDVESYVKEKAIEKIYVDLPDSFGKIKGFLESCLKSRLKTLYEWEVINSLDVSKVRKKDLLILQGSLARQAQPGDFDTYKQISVVAGCLKTMHALELLQSHGIGPLKEFFDKLESQSKTVKAARNLLMDWDFRRARILADGTKEEHPKLRALEAIVRKYAGKRMIIFTQFRSSVEEILKRTSNLEGIRAARFIGQKEGLSQRKQVEVLDKFKAGEFNVLICTTVGEEGIDIPDVPIAIFYDSVPSAIRKIQRIGRVGRTAVGKIYLLITRGTIDEKYYWIAHHKERRMYRLLNHAKEVS